MSGGFRPQVIIGIKNGGAQVARQMLASLPPEALYCEVCVTRPSTRQKEHSFAHQLLRHLPLWMCDALRIMESRMAAWRSSRSKTVRIGKVELSKDVSVCLQSGRCRVLIVDDAIDTGATMQKVRDQLLSSYPDLDIRIAAITVTIPHPLCEADYSLYHNRTLCRFPWSNDYRSCKN